MTPSDNNTLENLVNTLTDTQMTLPQDIICATISSHYHKNARIRITDFLNDPSQRMVTYGYSSGGARAHILYRSENGRLFLVFKTADRGYRVYYLRKDLLYDVFEEHENEIPYFEEHENEIPDVEEHENEIPDFDEHTGEQDELPPAIMSRTTTCS